MQSVTGIEIAEGTHLIWLSSVYDSICTSVNYLGEQVHIVYGDGTTTSNADLLGLYGFVDSSAAPADQVRE